MLHYQDVNLKQDICLVKQLTTYLISASRRRFSNIRQCHYRDLHTFSTLHTMTVYLHFPKLKNGSVFKSPMALTLKTSPTITKIVKETYQHVVMI